MRIVRTTPIRSPVSLDTAKAHLRLSVADEDAYIGTLLLVATQAVETYLGRPTLTATFEAWLDYGELVYRLGRFPYKINTITEVRLFDNFENETTTTAYSLVNGQLMWDMEADFGDPRWSNAAKITFTAGYGPSARDVPQDIIGGLLQYLAHLYEHRGDQDVAAPETAKKLLQPHRILTLR